MSSPDYSDGCMLALYPPKELAERLTVSDGLAADELHVTVAYLGDAADVDHETLVAAAKQLANRAPVAGAVSGHARFTGGEHDVIVALIDSADLEDLRRDTMDRLKAQGIDVPRDHGYTPHCTLTYLEADDQPPVSRLGAEPMEFTALSVVHGADRTDLPFRAPHPIESYARQAFAAGWASSGGPMTDRVKAASRAAVQMATEHAEDPRILEVTVHLGRLEGMWATLFHRREKLIAQYTTTVAQAWRPLITRRAFRDGIYQYRAAIGLTETTQTDDKARKAAALTAATAMLQALVGAPGWANLRQAIRDAIAAGYAEGMVAAVAIAAEQASKTGLDWDAAFQRAYQQLERLDTLWAGVDGWLGRLIARAAADLARALADQADSGATVDDMTTTATDLLSGNQIDAVGFTVDWAITAAAAAGAAALYQLAGATEVTWITVGDGRVCSTCDDNEANSPYTVDQVPEIPAHPRCRCTTSAGFNLDRFAAWFTNP